MAFTPCTHLSSTTADCDSNPPAGTPCVCVCVDGTGTHVRARIKDVHSATHGRLVLDTGTPPAGFAAVYDFVHDTSGTQSPGTTVDGDWVPYAGGSVQIRIRYMGAGGPTQYDCKHDQPTAC